MDVNYLRDIVAGKSRPVVVIGLSREEAEGMLKAAQVPDQIREDPSLLILIKVAPMAQNASEGENGPN